ncbi:MAG: response regulator [Ketobacter sp.]|nr:MAG: response regulator [Ketobacter sp.]
MTPTSVERSRVSTTNPVTFTSILFLLAFIAQPVLSYGTETAIVEAGFLQLHVGQYTRYHLDETQSQTLSDVRSLAPDQWFSATSEAPAFGFSADHLWMQIPVHNPTDDIARLALEIAYPVLDHVDVYVLTEPVAGVADVPAPLTETHYRMGDTYPFHDRPANHRNFVIPFQLPPSADATLYLMIASSGALEAPVILWDYEHFFENQQSSLVGQGLYFGIMIVMILYNLFIYLSVRHVSYLYYTGAALSCALFVAGLHGIGFQFIWPTLPAINSIILPASISGFAFTTIFFTITLLDVKRLAPKLYKLKIAFAVFFAAMFVLSMVLPYHLAIQMVAFIGVPSILLSLYTGAYMLHRGQRAARFFLLAWSSLLVSFLLTTFSKFGLIPASTWIEHSVQIGSALEVILLSFALADRINEERKAKHRAQQEALENEKRARQEQSRYLQLRYQAELDELKSKQQIFEARAESKAKGDFLATMSHEIRTPMNGVLGMADLLHDTELNENQRHYLNVITNSGKALLNVINDILDYSKIAAGKMELEHIDFDLDQLCVECTSIFTVTAERKNLELIYSMEPGTPAFIKSDPSRLRQVILNLLGNAFKFTHEGSVHLSVSELPSANNQHHILRFEVRDTGIGIDPQTQQKLFNAFAQADNRVARQFGGTGLGLSISKNLAQLMGGEVGIESTPNIGSCFWFTIQCESASPAFTRERIVPLTVLKGRRLLVVDNSPEFARMVCEQAKSWGMHVQSTQQASHALQILKQASAAGTPFEIVTLDRNLTDMKGLDCARAIKESDAITDCQCILLTASHNQPAQSELTKANITLCMQKPASGRSLRQVVISVINALKEQAIAHAESPPSLIEGKSILVVEDNNVNQMVIVGMLKKLKLKYTVAENGQAALNLYNRQHNDFDLVLMDCEMPIMDGYTTAENIRLQEAKLNLDPIPIIALTAHVLQEHRIKAAAAGMDAHVNKPVDFIKLTDTLTRHLLFDEPDSARA